MKRALLSAFAACLVGLAGPASAKDKPAVVELFTSQGCSSCPPADKLFGRLAPRDDVVALALHVDYWDYIGWKDTFGDHRFTVRQKGYARMAGTSTIYTPQMIVGGTDHVIGFKPMRVTELLQEEQAAPRPVALRLERRGDTLHIRARAKRPLDAPGMVQIMRYDPSETVAIRRGENAGRRITYHNIVTDWRKLGRWNGADPLDMTAQVEGEEPVVVLVQREGPGEILAVGRLR